MAQCFKWAAFIALSSVGTTACGAPLTKVEATESERSAAANRGEKVLDEAAPINQRFRDLDEYLAHLERTQAPIDKPWYREIRPGVFQLVTGNLRVLPTDGEEEKEQRVFTREELERKFGFTK